MKQAIYTKSTILAQKLRNFSLRVFHKLENNQNASSSENGESFLIDSLCQDWLAKTLKRPTLLDVGANQGAYASMCLNAAEKRGLELNLHLFEPGMDSFETLSQKFATDQVQLNHFGLSSKAEKRTIYFDRKGSTLASLYQRDLSNEGLTLDQKEEIQLKKLSQYIREREIDHIHFLKLDVEGHEYDSLLGMEEFLRPDFVDFIQFEYGGANIDALVPLRKLYALFESKGFAVGKLKPNGIERRTYQAFMENYAYANYIAFSGS